MQILKVIQQHEKTLEEVASALGVTKGTFSVSINGTPNVKRLFDIANYLGCSPAEFFADWDTAPENEHRIDPTAETQQPAPQPADGQQQGSAADELPFTGGGDGGKRQEAERTGGGQPTATVQQAIICPHCKRAIAITVNGI